MRRVGPPKVHLLAYLHSVQLLEERYILFETRALFHGLICSPPRLLILLSVATQRGSQTYLQTSTQLLPQYLLCPRFHGSMLHTMDRVVECRQVEEED
jgi:hypothetical protein